MSCYALEPKTRPKWWQIRSQIASWLVWIAKKIRPECPCVSAYFSQALIDYQICGKFVQRVDLPEPLNAKKEDEK